MALKLFLIIFLVNISSLASGLFAQYLLSIDSLKREHSAAQTDTSKVKIAFEIGREQWFQRNFRDAAYYLNESVTTAEKIQYYRYLADAYNLLANLYMKQEAFDRALNYLEKGIELNDAKFQPGFYETYSKLYYQLGDFQTSLQYSLQAAEEFEKNSHPLFNLQAVFSYLMVGDILNKLGRDEAAFEYYEKAYKKGLTAEKNWYIKTPLLRIASYHFSKGRLEKARHLYDTIIAIDHDAPSFEPTMHSYEGLGNIAMKENDFKKATDYYKQSLSYALRQGLSINARVFYTKLGSSFLGDHHYDSARYYLQLSISQSLKTKDYQNLAAAYKTLAEVYREQNQFQDALAALYKHESYHDSVLNVEKIRSVNNLEVLYRTRQKENEILRLQAVDQEKDFAIRKRNISIAIGVGLMFMMAIILILLRRTYRHKQKLQEDSVRQMERQHRVASLQSMINGQETERSRVARDLHDGLGGLFSTVKMYFSTLEHDHTDLRKSELFRKSFSLVDSASLEIRRIAHNMMPEVLMKMGLVNAVKDLSDNISAGRLLKVSLEVHGMNGRLDPATEIMLYRIIQELVNNVVKHAKASETIIQLIKDGSRLSVVVEDNGCGFDTLDNDGGTHTGIEAIKNRVNYLNGKLTIDSQKNIGTTVMMDFDLQEN